MNEHVDEAGEEYDAAERHVILNHRACAVVENDADGDMRHRIVERSVHRLPAAGMQLVFQVLFVDFRVTGEVDVLPLGNLHHLQPGQVLLHVLIERRQRLAYQAEQLSGSASEVVGDGTHQG